MSTNPVLALFLIFLSAIAGALLAKKIKLPSLLGFIAAGFLLGNAVPQLFPKEMLEQIAQLGITLLLFTIGLEFSFRRLQKTLKIIYRPAIVQILLTALIFFLATFNLGWSFLPAIFLSFTISLSSTAVVSKILADKGETDSVPGQLSIGWLVIQDLAVIPILFLLQAVTIINQQANPSFGQTFLTLLLGIIRSILAILLVVWLGKKLVPQFLGKLATLANREVFSLATLAVVVGASLTAYFFGISSPLGAFLAGLILAETSQNHAVFAEVRPLKDILVSIFFVSLGMSLPFSLLVQFGASLLIFALVILLVKGVLVYFINLISGHHPKTSFLVSLYLLSLSEFGFVLAQVGRDHAALTLEQSQYLIALTFLTIFLASPLVAYDQAIYYWCKRHLSFIFRFNRKNAELFPPEERELPLSEHIVICGYGRVGRYIGRALQMAEIPFIVIEYNQQIITELKDQGIKYVLGDPADKEVLDFAQVDLAKLLIIAIPDRHTQEMVIAQAQSLNRRLKIICRTHHEEDQQRLKSLGVTTIVQPEFAAALTIVEKLLTEFGLSEEDITGKIKRLKIEHGLG